MDRPSAEPGFTTHSDDLEGDLIERTLRPPPGFMSLRFKGDPVETHTSHEELVKTDVMRGGSSTAALSTTTSDPAGGALNQKRGIRPKGASSTGASSTNTADTAVSALAKKRAPDAANLAPLRQKRQKQTFAGSGSAPRQAATAHAVEDPPDIVMDNVPEYEKGPVPNEDYHTDPFLEGYDRSLLHRWRAGTLSWQQPRNFEKETRGQEESRIDLLQWAEAEFQEWDTWDRLDRLKSEAAGTFQEFVCHLDDLLKAPQPDGT
ncbi:hypothetical protein FA95DRAFT_1562902 [Auriscalpium vulgare]|uniref:Uncharacterized protein n=1 Tax=Auriscalpium vulgare TaxID=40419 RepID=A0ACB8RJD9_9AGAM|nr:hypothetical protein FA95DRAFT_1562902 [Auriscalpium vulgare]